MKGTVNTVLRIGAWRVDPALDEISKDGNTVKLEHRAMRLLVSLAEHAGQVVSVGQLLDEVWAGVVVTQDSVYHAGFFKGLSAAPFSQVCLVVSLPFQAPKYGVALMGQTDRPCPKPQAVLAGGTAKIHVVEMKIEKRVESNVVLG